MRLSRWYNAQCNGEWEHRYGISISTMDNPGWSVGIDLQGTPLFGKAFERVERNYESDTDWLLCELKPDGSQFWGVGGAEQLPAILQIFLDFAE